MHTRFAWTLLFFSAACGGGANEVTNEADANEGDAAPPTCSTVCAGSTPSCSGGVCVCTATSCADGDVCGADGVCQPVPDARGLGRAVELAEPCRIVGNDRGGTSCVAIQVTDCPDVPEAATVELRITAATAALEGVIVFGSGGSGSGFVESGTLPNRLASAGYTVMERAWREGWSSGGNGYIASACRYATVLHWIKANHAPSAALCATGNSGGAAELGYALGFYGVAQLLELVMPTGGPVAARWDLYCHGDANPSWLAQCDDGLPADLCAGQAPVCYEPMPIGALCSQSDEALLADSVLAPDAVVDYGATHAHFMQGLNDCGHPNVPIGLLYHDAVTSQKSLQFLANTPHVVTSTVEGQNAFYDAITTRCVQ